MKEEKQEPRGKVVWEGDRVKRKRGKRERGEEGKRGGTVFTLKDNQTKRGKDRHRMCFSDSR